MEAPFFRQASSHTVVAKKAETAASDQALDKFIDITSRRRAMRIAGVSGLETCPEHEGARVVRPRRIGAGTGQYQEGKAKS
jgi:hypothetical protein